MKPSGVVDQRSVNFQEQVPDKSKESVIFQKFDHFWGRIEKLEKQLSGGYHRQKVKCYNSEKFEHFKKDCFSLLEKESAQDFNPL